jgi:hypothetical protein
VVSTAFANSTTVLGALALLEQRSPVLSKTSAQGPRIEPLLTRPSSDRITFGTRLTVAGVVGGGKSPELNS